MILSQTTTGSMGEYITAAAIISLGWKVAIAQQDHLDLVAFNDNHFLRIQVKTATLKYRKHYTPGYQFNNGSGSKKKILTPEKYDILAHCAADHRRCVFYASHTVNQVTKRYAGTYFENPFIEQESWTKAIELAS